MCSTEYSRRITFFIAVTGAFLLAGCPPPNPGDTETIMLPGNVPLEMVWCPAGTFMMGRYQGEQDSYSNEDPQHQVGFSSGFWIGKYEVTQAQWEAVTGSNPSYFPGDNRPVEQVSWNDAQSFITALNIVTDRTFRLPSEAEWEYACRAGTTTRFYWGEDPTYTFIGNDAWHLGNSGDQTHDVGGKLANAWGLEDMSGNVWEWCEDDWHDNYTGAPTDGRAWVDSSRGPDRANRGGGFSSIQSGCRSAIRVGNTATSKLYFFGFRLAR
jgi:formylglycine-generating enzyme required for sulfatase activity